MHLSAQAEYGLRCLLQVARCGDDGVLTAPEISKVEGLSVPHVSKLMHLLRQGGVVQSKRGALGGYLLATSADKITVAQVLDLLGTPLYSSEFCENHSGNGEVCTHSVDCALRPVWRTVQEVLSGVFKNLTLQDLLCDEDEISRRIADLPVAIQRQRDQH